MPGERSPITVQKLENGVAYKFKAHAINGVGAGPRGPLSETAVPEAHVKTAPLKAAELGRAVAADGSVAQVPPQLRVTVQRAAGLAKADTFGQSDPYVVLHWEGGGCKTKALELGKTAVRKMTLNPDWGANEVFDVPLGDRGPLGVGLSQARAIVTDAENIARHRAMRGPSRGRARTRAESKPAGGAHVPAADVLLPGQSDATLAQLGWLVLEVHDWNRVGAHDFLGQLRLCGRELYAMSKGAGVQADGTITLELERKPPAELEERKQKLVQGSLTFALERLGDWPVEAEVHLEF